LAKPHLHQAAVADKARLRLFVPRGCLVFDIGANVGDVTALLLDIGARVVAVEPTPELAALIRKRYHVPVVQAAAGASVGTAELAVGVDLEHSTLSLDYQTVHPNRHSGQLLTVRVVTLDSLIAEHGRPSFVKIDVEGHELEVLRGLTLPIQALSFEFHASMIDRAAEALAILDRLGGYGYQFVENRQPGSSPLQPATPVDSRKVLNLIRGLMDGQRYGEIYARCL
jgi:FkbM family methyltransferase